MAIVECIPEKKQTPSAQKGVIDYCMQPSKTLEDGEQLAYVSGINCIPELAQESFLATQNHFGCNAGNVRFYHYVQSFKPEENLSPKEAHAIGLELAQSFGNREVIVATHIDRDHLHNHFVVSAYNFETGMKLHNNKFYLADLRKRSDEICRAHGLSTLKTYDPKNKSQRLGPKEYRAAERGNSWKMQLRVAIDYCMTRARSKSEFKREMKKLGYDMVYTPERKYITYILRTKDGQEKRVRDIKLNEEKYRKENMDNEFRIRAELYGQAEGDEYTGSATATAEGTEARSTAATERSAEAGNTARTDGADQRRRLGKASGIAQGDTPGQRADGTSGSGLSDSGVGIQTGNDDGSEGANGGCQEVHREAVQRSNGTGWESERQSLTSHRPTVVPGRSDLVATAGSDRHSDDLSLALMGARGAGHLTNLFEDDGEETDEQRKQRQAKNAAAAAGLAIGATVSLIQNALQKDKPIGENPNNGEDRNFDISM